jgi:hypothetical protein
MSKVLLNVVLAILAIIGLLVLMGLIGAGSTMGGMMMGGGMMGGGIWILLGLIVLLVLGAAAIVWIFLRR